MYIIEIYRENRDNKGNLLGGLSWQVASMHSQYEDAVAQYERFINYGILPENIRHKTEE